MEKGAGHAYSSKMTKIKLKPMFLVADHLVYPLISVNGDQIY